MVGSLLIDDSKAPSSQNGEKLLLQIRGPRPLPTCRPPPSLPLLKFKPPEKNVVKRFSDDGVRP